MSLTKVVTALAIMTASSGCSVFAWRPFSNLENHYEKMPVIETRLNKVEPKIKLDYKPEAVLNNQTPFGLGFDFPYEIGDLDSLEFNWGFEDLTDKKLGKFYK